MLVLDEAQELGRSNVRFDSIIAYVYDYLNLRIVVSGSNIGLLYRFLKVRDPEAPPFGRPYLGVKLNRLDEAKAREFLVEGFEMEGINVSNDVVEEALRSFDGIIGWLTYFGYSFTGTREPVNKIAEKVSRLAVSELEHALKLYGIAKPRYERALRIVASLGRARWREVKRGVEARLGKKVPNNTFYIILKNLIDLGFLEKEETYIIPAPVLKSGVMRFL